jgi:hypothetical protein
VAVSPAGEGGWEVIARFLVCVGEVPSTVRAVMKPPSQLGHGCRVVQVDIGTIIEQQEAKALKLALNDQVVAFGDHDVVDP